uniref:Uncharacterized protein n=1 Tax=Anguilla anguilla TaxID=7936 RepID=A0A0E9QYK4_ANGAN
MSHIYLIIDNRPEGEAFKGELYVTTAQIPCLM